MKPETFATRLRRLVADRGLTLRRLSKMSGVTAQNLPAYLDGSISPRINTAVALAEALAVPAGWLAFGEDVNQGGPGPAAFAGNLRMYRQARGLTQTDVAKRSGISAMTISALERTERQPSVHQAIVLAEVLGLSPSLLTLGQHLAAPASEPAAAAAGAWITAPEHRYRVALTVLSRISFAADSAIAIQIPAGDLCSLLNLEPTKKNQAYVEKVWEEMKTYFPVFVRHLAGKTVEPS